MGRQELGSPSRGCDRGRGSPQCRAVLETVSEATCSHGGCSCSPEAVLTGTHVPVTMTRMAQKPASRRGRVALTWPPP